ncbi:hypothetical protein COC42_12380 [Sphingomonas spermidinifaciens]|uniref:Cell envelope biogenesis protein TolA n=1 Tax=Sphingomonas spermidinifaciens TaxID=1141889 RepID=A0A2A4B2Q6_9SPHN|nr:hypothetical protein [Sphingomonas spermidinifaciens]PCD02245.1 hypothetical protein COC42_12380 [Sphingomonas spermidinifaciens]
MARKLKVFRTPIGFHDAYVAATSRKAALEAWGADADLFARGIAEEVTDPSLMEAALEQPGAVVRKVRGTVDEHMAALPPDAKPNAGKAKAGKAQPASKPKPKAKPRPRPSRAALDEAEAAVDVAKVEYEAARDGLEADIAALEKKRRGLDQEYREAAKALDEKRAAAEERYRSAMDHWRQSN